uniref:PARP catalytic domain-containing protein n=1 Tax=Oryza punctata TaxID=4537 RepID=A0A0E0K384_ORYPU
MAAGSWVRSFHCKSTAIGDVAAAITALPKKPHLHLPRSSCASSGDAHNHKNVSSSKAKPAASSKASPAKPRKPKAKAASVPPSSPPPGPLGPVPALTELPAGHSSRQVVEIIFLSSWSPLPVPQAALPAALACTAGAVALTAEVEMLFRVHNPARAVSRFEDYRAAVRARAGGASRSAADGNEMMRFSPAPPDGCSSAAGDDALSIRTFDGSGGAHANGRGPASGRRAMFLCRVIAGRVADGPATSGTDADDEPVPSKEYDSVRAGKGELVVFDRRAVLPCFLIIYKL